MSVCTTLNQISDVKMTSDHTSLPTDTTTIITFSQTQESSDQKASKQDSLYNTVVEQSVTKRINDCDLLLQTSVVKTLPQSHVSSSLQAFIRTLNSSTRHVWNLKAFECGGAGDCLFHTIKEGINVLKVEYEDVYNNLFAQHGELITTAQGLRYLSAKALVAEGHEDFLNKCE